MEYCSQIYVIAKKDGKYYLTGNYYECNYGVGMISRAKGILEEITKCSLKDEWRLTTETHKLRRIMDIDWDMHDLALSFDMVKDFFTDEEPWIVNSYNKTFYEYCFAGQYNCSGQCYFFIDLDKKEENRDIKLCFTPNAVSEYDETMTAEEYLNKTYSDEENYPERNNSETILYTEKNMEYINKHSKMMSMDELISILKEVSKCYERKKYLSADEFRELKAGDIIGVELADGWKNLTCSTDAFYNDDCDEPGWEIETNGGMISIDNTIIKRSWSWQS